MDINTVIPGASNFKYTEFVKSNTANEHGIKNLPRSERVWKNIDLLARKCLQPIRDKFGPIRILSGYRCPKLCLLVGSTIYSNHTRGEAADLEPVSENISLFEVFEWIINNLKFRELILEHPPKGWIHLTYRLNGNSRIVKLKDKNHNYSKVDISYIKSTYEVA